MSAEPPTPRPPAPAAPFADHDALPAGTRFGEFEVIRVLGVGGFGIVYLAQDHSLERRVALKEYMPASLASRGAGPAVTVRSAAFAETYAIGLRSFVNEARLLARFDHPSLVKVYRFWEDNATAYMVMPYLQGITLRDARRAMAQPPDEAWIRSVLEPMLDALEQLHREGVFHRDIAPDNILLPPEGAPILLDFGAARRVISDRTQSLTAILKPSYAPIEQYADMTSMRQGPWTDVYALGAVMHYLLFGAPPAPATARAVQHDAQAIEHRVVPGVSAHFMSVVAWMLGVRPLERPQSVASVRAALSGQLAVPATAQAGAGLPGVPVVPVIPGLVAAPFAETRIEPTFQPTLLIESAHSAPTRIETVFQPTAFVPTAGLPPPPVASTVSALPDGTQSATLHDNPGVAVPPPIGPAAPPLLGAVAGPSVPVRRGVVIMVMGGVAALALLLLWQFAGVVGAPRESLAAASAASSARASPAASAVAPAGAAQAAAAAAAPASAAVVVGPLAPAAFEAAPAASVAAAAPMSTPVASARAAPPVATTAGAVAARLPTRPRARSVPARPADPAAPAPAGAGADTTADDPTQRAGVSVRDASLLPSKQQSPAAATPAPASAREACGSRVFIAMALCLERECENPRFRDQPECARLMEIRRNRTGQ